MFQVVLNYGWDWASPEQKTWFFVPHEKLEHAEWQAQDMLSRGTARVEQIGIACCLRCKS